MHQRAKKLLMASDPFLACPRSLHVVDLIRQLDVFCNTLGRNRPRAPAPAHALQQMPLPELQSLDARTPAHPLPRTANHPQRSQSRHWPTAMRHFVAQVGDPSDGDHAVHRLTRGLQDLEYALGSPLHTLTPWPAGFPVRGQQRIPPRPILEQDANQPQRGFLGNEQCNYKTLLATRATGSTWLNVKSLQANQPHEPK